MGFQGQPVEDPTVIDPRSNLRSHIEQLAGVSLQDTDPEQIRFIVSQSKQAGNALFKERKYKGSGMNHVRTR